MKEAVRWVGMGGRRCFRFSAQIDFLVSLDRIIIAYIYVFIANVHPPVWFILVPLSCFFIIWGHGWLGCLLFLGTKVLMVSNENQTRTEVG